jgi:hypothetical protein
MIVKHWKRLCDMTNDRLLEKSFLENVALALQQKPFWCMSLQIILAPFEFVIQVDPQPFGTDFVADLKNRFIENFMESSNSTTKINLETYNAIRTGESRWRRKVALPFIFLFLQVFSVFSEKSFLPFCMGYFKKRSRILFSFSFSGFSQFSQRRVFSFLLHLVENT